MPTSATDLSPALRARYGLVPVARWKVVVGAVVALVLVAAAGYAGWRIVNPAVTATVVAFRVVSPQEVAVTFDLNRPPDRTAVCVVRAQDESHHDVGYATVTVPPGSGHLLPTYRIATRATATIAEVLGCGLDVAPQVQAPQFPPGTANPPQQPSVAGS